MAQLVLGLIVAAALGTLGATNSAPPFNVHRVPAKPPLDAARHKAEGHVSFEARVNETGSVTDVRILDASPRGVFEVAVREAVLKWTFVPLCSNTFAHPFSFKGGITFSLRPAGEGQSPIFSVEDEVPVNQPGQRLVTAPNGSTSIVNVDPCGRKPPDEEP
jgi:TonB family protein